MDTAGKQGTELVATFTCTCGVNLEIHKAVTHLFKVKN